MAKYPPPNVPYVQAQHSGGKQIPTLLVIHSTVTTSVKGAALGVANMWHRTTSPISSAHYVVDEEITIQCVYDHTIAYHCGYNTGSLGLEMCDDPSDGKDRWVDQPHKGVLEGTADLAASLCLTYNIQARYLTDAELLKWGKSKTTSNGGITTHAQMSRVFKASTHWDPGEWPSTAFLNRVKELIIKKSTPVGPVKLEFDNTHCAGRFDQSVVLFDKQMDDMMEISDAVGVTEIDKNARARQLKAPGWNAIWGDKGPRDDCGITTKKSKFKVIFEETHTCSHTTYINERGNRTDTTECAFQVVENKESGQLVLLGEIHTPHGMGPELRRDKVRSDVAKAYQEITQAYLNRARVLMRKYKVKLAALSGDWNLNFRFAWVRNWFRKNFEGWKMNWSYLELPGTGTHGREIIDGTLLKGLKPTKRKMLPRGKGNDHSGFTEHLVAI